MKEIPLYRGKEIVAFALVDDENYDELNRWTWRGNEKGRAVRCYNIKGKKFHVFMHRVITNAPVGVEVDHKDRNPLNNQKGNLRFATRQQNQSNAPKQRGLYTSKYKGVSLCSENGKWHAGICINLKSFNLGYYDTEIEAAKVYDQQARRHFGEFAYLNFPLPMDGTDYHTFGEC